MACPTGLRHTVLMRVLYVFLALASCLLGQGLSGRRAPGFSLPDSQFNRHDLQDYRGKWVLLEFMNTQCPHCKVLSKTLEQVKKKYAGRLEVLSVVIAPPENTNTVTQYVAETKITTPVVFDQGQMAASYFNMRPPNASFDTPHLFIIDPNGMIVRDVAYSDQNKDLMEGRGLFKVMDTLLAAKK